MHSGGVRGIADASNRRKAVMVLRRGSNIGIGTPGAQALVPGYMELASMEDLGPKTRAAIDHAPIKILATSIVSQIIDVNEKIYEQNITLAEEGKPQRPYLDPKSPDLDARLANGVLSHQVDLLHQDRSIEDAMAGVIPLRARPSPKSMREQRRSERAARRARW
jgi:hypothetical protein